MGRPRPVSAAGSGDAFPGIASSVAAGFAIGFSRNTELGWQLVAEWFVINGVLSGGATLLALAHPVTVIATVFAASSIPILMATLGPHQDDPTLPVGCAARHSARAPQLPTS